MTYLKPIKDLRRSLNKYTSQEEQRFGINKSNINTNNSNIYGNNLNRFKTNDINQDTFNKDNTISNIKKIESKFNHRGRFLQKNENQNINQKFQSCSLKLQHSIPLIQQFVQNEKSMNDSPRTNTPKFKINNFQIQLQKSGSQNSQIDENILQNLRINKIYSSEISDSSTLNKDDSNTQRKNNFQKESIFKSQAYSILDNTNNLDLQTGKNTPTLQKTKSESKHLNNLYQKKTFKDYISPKKSSNFMNSGWKSQKKYHLNLNQKSQQKQNTLDIKDKLSNSEYIDDFSLPNQDFAKTQTQNANKNQNNTLMSPYLKNSQVNEENLFKSEKLNQSVENVKQLKNPQIQKILKLSQQLTLVNNVNLNQQESNQSQNQEILNNLSRKSVDQPNISDYVILNIQISNSKDVFEELGELNENKDQQIQNGKQINSTDITQKDQGLIIKKTKLESDKPMISTKQVTNISFITENIQVKELQQINENNTQNYSEIQNSIEKDEIFQNDKEQKQEFKIINQQTYVVGENQDVLQHSPIKMKTELQKGNSIYVMPVQPLEENNIANQEEIQHNKQIYFQPEFQNLDQLIDTNQKIKDDSPVLLDQQIIVTESENQQTVKENSDLSQLNSINQTTQKSLPNINSNSNFYGSESTNETNSSKRSNLNSFQLSNSFGKQNQNMLEQKAKFNSYERKYDSSETFKIQQKSNNVIEFAIDSLKNTPNEEEDREKPEVLQYHPQPFLSNIQISPQMQSIQKNIRLSNNQQSSLVDNQFDSFVNITLKSHQKQQQSQQFGQNSNEKLKNSDGKQDNIIFSNEELNNQSGKSSSYKLIQLKKDKINSDNNQKLSQNQDFSHQSFDQNKKVQTISNKDQEIYSENKKVITQNNEGGINDNNKQQNHQIPRIQQQEIQREKIINIQKIIDEMQLKQCVPFQSQTAKEININKQNSISSPKLDAENVQYKNISIKNTNQNEFISQRLTQNDQLIISPKQDTNTIKQTILEDFSPRKNIYDYKSFWDHFQQQEDKPRKFTCKELCYLFWPQKLDRKQRLNKELILKLYQTDYNKDDKMHINLLDAVSLHYNRLLHGNYNQSIDDKQYTRNRFQRNTVHVLPNKPVEDQNNKRIQSLSNLFNQSQNMPDLKIFTLIHILAFLNISKDVLDQSYRRFFKKIQLFFLLLRISNVVVQKFQSNLFDKCIKILNKDAVEFLNDIFYQIFYESINSIISLEKFETNQMTIKLFDKINQINDQLNSTDQIIKFIQNNNHIQQSQQQNQWSIVY